MSLHTASQKISQSIAMDHEGSQEQAGKHDEILQYFIKMHPETMYFLNYTTPYTLLVAVVLSAQATDRSVNKIMPILIEYTDSPEKMLVFGVNWLRSVISTIGLYQRKSQYIMALSTQLILHHHSQVPETREDLMALPGVGRKTANVILNTLFGWPTIPVDTHVERVSKRLGWVDSLAHPLQVEHMLDSIIPLPWKRSISTWLILHGRTFCTARSPRCSLCPLCQKCAFFQKNSKTD